MWPALYPLGLLLAVLTGGRLVYAGSCCISERASMGDGCVRLCLGGGPGASEAPWSLNYEEQGRYPIETAGMNCCGEDRDFMETC